MGGGQDLLGPQDPPGPDLDGRGLSTVDRGAGVRDFKGLAVGVRGVLRVWEVRLKSVSEGWSIGPAAQLLLVAKMLLHFIQRIQ